jgi:pimeloyl-ACP methyl ester carboxylesterase
MSALQENACLKRMTPSPIPSAAAAVIEAFAGIHGLLEQAPALMARGRAGKIDTGVCPLDLLTGECDFSCTPEDTRRTAAPIGGASVIIMEQLGHFPMSENPGQFRRYIAPVLSQILKQSTTSTKQGAHV